LDNELISVRLKPGTKERLKKLGINTSEEVRKYLEELAWKQDVLNTMNKLEILLRKHSKPSKSGFAVMSVREDRDENH
jgi:hypothetical protein